MLNALPVLSIVDAVGRAAAIWGDPAAVARRRARDAACIRTGYPPAVVDYALDRLFAPIQREAIERIIVDELGSLEVLDRFVARRAHDRARALPAGRVCIISSRTTIGVAIVPLIFALCAKCRVLVKDREDELVGAFLATLAGVEPQLAEAAVARAWRSDRDSVDVNGFDLVVAFGSDATLQAISASLRVPTRLISYPSKTSAGYISRKALPNEAACEAIAAAASRDALLYDGEGCLSLHLLFVQRGGPISEERVACVLRGAFAKTASGLPSTVEAGVMAMRALRRDAAAFHAPVADRVFSDNESNYLLRVNGSTEEPPVLLPRSLQLIFVDSPSQALVYLQTHGIAIEALAIAEDDDVGELAILSGASRVTRFGSLQAPPLGAFHGGRPRIAEFVRWIVDER